jgi:hypothetical protein
MNVRDMGCVGVNFGETVETGVQMPSSQMICDDISGSITTNFLFRGINS